MTNITTEEAERFARWCDIDGFTQRAAALRSLAGERDALQAENARLREALENATAEERPIWETICNSLAARAALGEKE